MLTATFVTTPALAPQSTLDASDRADTAPLQLVPVQHPASPPATGEQGQAFEALSRPRSQCRGNAIVRVGRFHEWHLDLVQLVVMN